MPAFSFNESGKLEQVVEEWCKRCDAIMAVPDSRSMKFTTPRCHRCGSILYPGPPPDNDNPVPVCQ